MGADDATQRMFGCLWRVLCDSHGPARWTRLSHTSAKSVHWSPSCVHIVVALRHHVGVGVAGMRAHVSCYHLCTPNVHNTRHVSDAEELEYTSRS